MKRFLAILLCLVLCLGLLTVAHASGENPNAYTLTVTRRAGAGDVYDVTLTHTAGGDELGLLAVRLNCVATAVSGEAVNDSGAAVGYADGVISITMNRLDSPLALAEGAQLTIATFMVTADAPPALSYTASEFDGATNPGNADEATLTVELPVTPRMTEAPTFAAPYTTLTAGTTAATLTLTEAPVDGTSYAVYAASEGGEALTALTAAADGTTLTLTVPAAQTAANVWIAATAAGQDESPRVPVSVYVHDAAAKTLSVVLPAAAALESGDLLIAAQYKGLALLSTELPAAASAYTLTLADDADSCKLFVLRPAGYAPVCRNIVWTRAA